MGDAKRDLIKAWLTKALHDLTAARTVAASAEPLFDVGAFHCQQAAEKAVKAYLVFRDRPFPKTHDVAELPPHASPKKTARRGGPWFCMSCDGPAPAYFLRRRSSARAPTARSASVAGSGTAPVMITKSSMYSETPSYVSCSGKSVKGK